MAGRLTSRVLSRVGTRLQSRMAGNFIPSKDLAFHLDFKSEFYWADGQERTLADVLAYARTGDAYDIADDGSLITFAADEAPIVAGRGLRVDEGATNLLPSPTVPVTRTVTVSDATTHVLSVYGSGSAEITAGGSGTATEGNPLQFDTTATSVTVTVTGSLDAFNLTEGEAKTAFVDGTRNAPTQCEGTALVAGLLNASEGTLVVDVELDHPEFTAEDNWAVQISDGASDRVYIYAPSDQDYIRGGVNSDGSVKFAASDSLLNASGVSALSYANSDFNFYLNGVSVGDQSSGDTPLSLSDLYIGNVNNTLRLCNGYIRRITYYDKANASKL